MGINKARTQRWTSKNDPDPENPTVFHIGVLDQIIKTHIEDESTQFIPSSNDPEGEAEIKILFSKRTLLTIKFGVLKIENFFDPGSKKTVTVEAEEIVIFGQKYSALPDKALAAFPPGKWISELTTQILKLNSLSEDEIKN